MDSKSDSNIVYKTYPMRWVVLGLYLINSMISASFWAQYSIIEDIIKKYYSISNEELQWTSLAYLITFCVFFLPGTFLINRLGLRWTTFLAGLITAIGVWLKLASIDPGRFWLGLVTQFICGTAQVLVVPVPPLLAALWFPFDQLATITAIGFFGNQIGICLSFLTAPMLVRDSENLDEIGSDLFFLFLYMAVAQTIVLGLILFFFTSQPPTPPSATQTNAAELENFRDFYSSMKRLCKNRNFMLMLLAYGINGGIFYCVSILLGEIILTYFQGAHELAGLIGNVIIIVGIIGSIICAQLLDRTRKFKEVTLLLYVCTTIGMMAFIFMVETQNQIAVYCSAGFLGFSMAGYLPIAVDFTAELTYPEKESTTSGCLGAVTQISALIIVPALRPVIDMFGYRTSCLVLTAILFFGTGITACITSDLRRQKANLETKNKLNVVYSPVAANIL